MLSLLFLVFATYALLRLRVSVVSKVRRREIRAAACRAVRAFAHRDPNWQRLYYDHKGGPSFERQLLQLHKWTHAQFYPGSEA